MFKMLRSLGYLKIEKYKNYSLVIFKLCNSEHAQVKFCRRLQFVRNMLTNICFDLM